MNSNITYAGFWKRFAAYLLDQLILGIVRGIIFIPFWIFALVSFFTGNGHDKFHDYVNVSFQHFENEFSIATFSALFFIIIIFGLINLIIEWLYYALMESSQKQATFGKIILGIKVTDLFGNRISFGKATGRYFGKILSGLILCIGYLMAGFTDKKQALHDMLSNCLVINSISFNYYDGVK